MPKELENIVKRTLLTKKFLKQHNLIFLITQKKCKKVKLVLKLEKIKLNLNWTLPEMKCLRYKLSEAFQDRIS